MSGSEDLAKSAAEALLEAAASDIAAYSTRGRTEVAEEPVSAPPPPRAESFLSETLTEEERRTRTRYIPNVTGMGALKKQEIKSDLNLARSLELAGKKRGKRDDDPEGEDSSEDDRIAEILRSGGRIVDFGSTSLVLPSSSFVEPTVAEKTKPSPREVEAISAFNPPQPRESTKGKKKQRMQQWEQKPSSIDEDLKAYRNTVEGVKNELRQAQANLTKTETVENHIRTQCLFHIRGLEEEAAALKNELAKVQQECFAQVNAEVDLSSSSRTRTRGAGKDTSSSMREVLGVLKGLGEKMAASGHAFVELGDRMQKVKGCGGVGAKSLENRDHSTTIEERDLASCWIVPGDTIETSLGKGAVQGVVQAVNVFEEQEQEVETEDKMEEETEHAGKDNETSDNSEQKEAEKVLKPSLINPRAIVDIGGVEHSLPITSLQIVSDSCRMTDASLAKRWQELVKTALDVGSVLDVEAMARVKTEDEDQVESTDDKQVDSDVGASKPRLLPFNSDLMPTASGRGQIVALSEQGYLEQAIVDPLYKGIGVTGERGSHRVPSSVSNLESTREEKLRLQAQARQLQNKVVRQRRIRMQNERTLSAAQEKVVKSETLVSEMRADLKSLKSRLDDELSELGISPNEAAQIVSNYLKSLETQDQGPSAKRPGMESDLSSDEDGMEVESETKQ